MPRNQFPDDDPIYARLKREGSVDAEDVIVLIGFVGSGRQPDDPLIQPPLRLHPDRGLQRWLEIPRDAVVDTMQMTPGDELTRSVVWADRTTMMQEIDWGPVDPFFDDDSDFRPPLSKWNLIPENRLTAAALLGLIWHVEGAYE